MKKDMITCIRTLSEDEFDTLEDIICNKYKKFCNLYWMIREYSDNISRIKYDKKSSKDLLKIELEIIGMDITYVLNELSEKVETTHGARIRQSGKQRIVIELSQNEE